MTSRASHTVRWVGPLVCLSLALLVAMPVVVPWGASLAHAGGQPIDPAEFPTMRRDLVEGDAALRDGVLNALKNAPVDAHPRVYGEVLGPLFRDPDATAGMTAEARRELFAVMIQHLADDQPEPDSDVILLAEAFLPAMVSDAKLIDRLLAPNGLRKDYATKVRKGWRRILDRARELLTDKNDAVRRAAIRVSARCDCQDMAAAIAALYTALKNSPQPLPAKDAESYLAAAELLLKHRFPDAGQLQTFLEPFVSRFPDLEDKDATTAIAESYRLRGDLLEAVIEVLKDRGGAQMSSAKKAALAYGRQLIAKATTPGDLMVFFDPDEERFVELQRSALDAATTRMKPEASEPWADLLTSALLHSADREVLQGALAIIGPTFKKGSALTQRLAAAVATRLEQRVGTDDPKQRVALAAILGDIGSRADVVTALVSPLDMFDAKPQDVPVYSELIRALGRVQGGFVVTLKPYYVNEDPRRSPAWQRLAVAKALGGGGVRSDELQSKLAGLFLRHILTGQAVTSADNVAVGVPAEPPEAHLLRDEASGEGDPDVRAAAIESLRWYPGTATATILAQIAAEASPAAKRALTILGRQLEAGSLDAAEALAGLVTESTPSELLHAVLDTILGSDASAADPVTEHLSEAARRILVSESPEVTEPLRVKAAEAATHLADAKALELVRALWTRQEAGSEARTTWGNRLEALFAAAATRGRDDPTLVDQLQDIADEGLRDEVIRFFDKMGKSAERFPLKRKRADILTERATDPDRTPALQRQDLDAAILLYSQLVEEATTPAGKVDMRRLLFSTLVERSQPARLAAGEQAAAFQLQAYKVARDAGARDVVRRALETLKNVLTQNQQLSDAERAEVTQITKALEALAANGDAKKSKK